MSRKKKNSTTAQAREAMGRQRREALLNDLRDGRVQRATRIPDARKEASRRACR